MHQEVDVLIFLVHAQKGKFWMFTFSYNVHNIKLWIFVYRVIVHWSQGRCCPITALTHNVNMVVEWLQALCIRMSSCFPCHYFLSCLQINIKVFGDTNILQQM